jgi:hypothetical protein
VSDETPEAGAALACRRDALLLLVAAWVVVAWAWDGGAPLALIASIITGGMFALVLGLLRQGMRAGQQVGLPAWWALVLVVLAALPATLLLGWGAGRHLGSLPIAGVLALLALGWQIWLYFWMTEPPDTTDEVR